MSQSDTPGSRVPKNALDIYDPRFLGADDLDGASPVMTIADVRVVDDVYDFKTKKKVSKVVVFFEETKRGVVLGRPKEGKEKTRSMVKATGTRKTAEWVGKKVQLITVDTNIGPGIRFRSPQ